VATGVPSATTPNGLVASFPGWFVWPYLIFAIVQLFAINTIDLYSSGVTLQSIFPRLRRLRCVAIDTVVCGFVAAYAVFSSHFYTLLSDFLLFIILWLGPWCGIYLVDSLLRRNRYDTGALLNERGGRYFRNGGFHWPAIVAQVLGMAVAALWLNAYSPYVGYFAARNGGSFGSDFSVFLGLAVGSVVYFLLAGRQVKKDVITNGAA
jgi:NCS1 family nucleobase:cation symporter-1